MRFWLVIIVVTIMLSTLPAQRVEFTIEGVPNLYRFSQLQTDYDVNRDGYDDFTIGLFPYFSRRQIGFFCGKTGQLLRVVFTPQYHKDWDFRHVPRPCGDHDRDGFEDYITILENNQLLFSSVQIRSGKDDRVLKEFVQRVHTYAQAPLQRADYDGDGKSDYAYLLFGPSPEDKRWVEVYRQNGFLLWKRDFLPNWGIYAIGIGDVNGDGSDDIAWRDEHNAVKAVSGKDGSTIYTVRGPQWDDALGTGGITGCGDIDADGCDDWAVSSNVHPGPSLVMVISGKSGQTLFTWRRMFNGFSNGYGCFVHSGHDVDGDGIADLAVGAAEPKVANSYILGRIFIYSLRTGRELFDIGPPHGQNLGACGSFLLPPLPGKTFGRVLTGDRGISDASGPVGRIYPIDLTPDGVATVGQRCPGKSTYDAKIGLSNHGAEGIRYHLHGAPPAAPAFLFLGTSATQWGSAKLPLSLDAFGLPGCLLYTSVDTVHAATTGTSGIDKGYAYAELKLPLGIGSKLYAQWYVLDPTQPSHGLLTRALETQH